LCRISKGLDVSREQLIEMTVGKSFSEVLAIADQLRNLGASWERAGFFQVFGR
jgi:hypothetical protein